MHVDTARRFLAALCLDPRVRARRLRAAELDVAITYLGRQEPPAIPLSLVEPVLTDEGSKGAQQAIRDNQTTGRFLKHDYGLIERVVPQADAIWWPSSRGARGRRAAVRGRPARHRICWRWRRPPMQAGALLFNGRAEDDELRTDKCFKQHVPHRALARHEGRRAGAVSRLEALAALVPGLRLASRGQGAGRCLSPRGRRASAPRSSTERVYQDTGGATAHRHRPCPDPEPDAGVHPGCRRLRRAGGRGRERRVRRVPRLSDLGRAAGGRQRRPGAGVLEPGAGAVGRHPGAAPVREVRRAADDRARLRRLGGRADHRRGGDPLEQRRAGCPARLHGRATSSRSRPSRARA